MNQLANDLEKLRQKQKTSLWKDSFRGKVWKSSPLDFCEFKRTEEKFDARALSCIWRSIQARSWKLASPLRTSPLWYLLVNKVERAGSSSLSKLSRNFWENRPIFVSETDVLINWNKDLKEIDCFEMQLLYEFKSQLLDFLIKPSRIPNFHLLLWKYST